MTTVPQFAARYPLSAALGLKPVTTAPGVEHPGADEDAVKAVLGSSRFANLMTKVSHVFSCGHRIKDKAEAHCVYLEDIEAFLRSGG